MNIKTLIPINTLIFFLYFLDIVIECGNEGEALLFYLKSIIQNIYF